MRSYSEIDTIVKRSTKAKGFSWGVAEEIGKNIRLLELFGLEGIKTLNQYYKLRKNQKFENFIFRKFDIAFEAQRPNGPQNQLRRQILL